VLSQQQAEGYHVTDSIEFQKLIIHINITKWLSCHLINLVYPHMATATSPHEEHVFDTHVFQDGSDRSFVAAWLHGVGMPISSVIRETGRCRC
jgi:hypothetical protein